ncbi:MAG TPA: NADH-quinone oxidoreductase subunit N [Phycisphaerae bacterium]|nr:NADH-quinone oxidoreductase subunit N [Phycisphaerae bacterium]
MTSDSLHPLIAALLPELILVIGASLVLLLGLGGQRSASNGSSHLAILTLIVAFWATWRPADTGPVASLNIDALASYARMATLSVGLVILLAARHVPEAAERGEFHALILFSLAGVMLVTAANDLILLFLALELVSVPTYILVGLSRRDIRAQEATGKYFFLGALAAALTLYGFSFLYGTSGTTQLFSTASAPTSIAAHLALPSNAADRLVTLGVLLAIAGLAFKIAAVPLHFYVADVYQGAASPVTGLLGFVPKFAGLLALIRLMSLRGWEFNDAMFWLLWAMAAATMTVGNTLALMQHSVKRMLAYSSIAHSGYMLVGLLAGPGGTDGTASSPLSSGIGALIFYMTVYGVMNLGAFACLSYFRKPGADDEEDSADSLDDLAGTAARHPWACLALAICVLSLMGLPPTGGFFGKLYVFSAALSASAGTERQAAMILLVLVGVLNSAVAAAYYLRIVGACYVRKPAAEHAPLQPSACPALRLAMVVCATFILAAFWRPGLLFDQSRRAGIAAANVRILAGQSPVPEPTADSAVITNVRGP